MPEYLAPGVYVEEVRGDVVPIQGVSTSTAGFVGLTQRGPTQAVLITSWPEFLRWYGDPLDPAQSALPLSVRGFFANGGQRVFVARITRSDAKSASLELAAAAARPTITALGPGAWANTVQVQVSAATRDPNRFRLRITYGTVTEDFDELSADPKDSRFARGVVNTGSHAVTLSWPDGETPSAPTHVAATPLAGGSDGTADLTADSLIGDPAVPPDQLKGLSALAAVDDVAILAVPDAVNGALLAAAEQNLLQSAIIEQCETLRDRVAVLDVPAGAGDIETNPGAYLTRRSNYAAIYYPHLRVIDPRSRVTVLVPPSGFVAGIYAFNDVTRGVHKAPANYEVQGILTADLTPTEGPLEFPVTKGAQDVLNPFGINAFRDFRSAGRGIRLWGARTISDDPEWIYVNVRRLFNFVEKSVDRGLQWLVFEPNAEPTWARVRRTIETFLEQVWRDGALMGTTREEAFFVRCDRTTMSTDDILNGRLICLIGLAAVRPAEFVILRFSQFTAEATS
jgi:Bacteriophage tail sheath protein